MLLFILFSLLKTITDLYGPTCSLAAIRVDYERLEVSWSLPSEDLTLLTLRPFGFHQIQHLGDAVLGACITELIVKLFPKVRRTLALYDPPLQRLADSPPCHLAHRSPPELRAWVSFEHSLRNWD